MERKCEYCGDEAEIGNKVESVFHLHNNASGICRKVKFVGHFKSVDGTVKPKLCLKCQGKVIRGMTYGGNWG